MNELWALIQSGSVVNLVWALDTDYQDPTYTWVDITSMSPQPAIGWTYSGGTFTSPPSPPIDWSATLESDIYTIQSSYLQALADYQAAQTAGSQSDADAGIAAGVSDSESSYTPNEASPFTALVAIVSTGG